MGTCNAIIALARDTYPDLDPTTAQTWLQEIAQQVVQDGELRNTQFQVNITSGVQTYDFPSTAVDIRQVLYVTGQYATTVLDEKTLSEMEDEVPDWRFTPPSTPSVYVVNDVPATASNNSKFVIELYPVPNTTTSGGYPYLNISATSLPAFSGTDSPPALLNDDVYAEGLRARYARQFRPELEDFHSAEFDKRMDEALLALKRRSTTSYQLVPVPLRNMDLR